MTADTIYAQLSDVFREVFMDDDITVGPDTTAKDIADWDSLRHINLLVAIEERFNIQFTTTEIEKLSNVSDLEKIIAARAA
jgi:acyl carrier protein